MVLLQGVLVSIMEIHGKIFKIFLLQNHLAQMLEIRYVALPSGPLPILFKGRSQGPRWPRARGSWVQTIEIYRKILKNLLLQNHLA